MLATSQPFVHDLGGGKRRMTWQRVAALGLLIGGAVLAAALHSELIAATLAGAAAGFAVNREGNGGATNSPQSPPAVR
jgi:hypothetical protein